MKLDEYILVLYVARTKIMINAIKYICIAPNPLIVHGA